VIAADEHGGPDRQVPPHLDVIPRRGAHELLQLLMIDPEPFRHKLHRLALAVSISPRKYSSPFTR
jgi:hypothetical protein